MGGRITEALFEVTDLQVDHGLGSRIWTVDGDEYLDFSAGIAVASTGHCHPAVVEAITTQAGRFIHAQSNCYRHDLIQPLVDRLEEITPGAIDTFFLANSGAEAVEASVKLAKQATGRTKVIVFRGGFHGRTHLAMALTTSKYSVRAGFEPLPSGITVAPFPFAFGGGASPHDLVDASLAELDQLLLTEVTPSEVAAFLIEPVLGEGGYVPAPTDFLVGLRERADEHGILLIADEIQSGFGRTGRMFAMEAHSVVPDIVTMAKGMASGFPISAVGAPAAVFDHARPGSHGGTYGGNPMGCAAALATIEVITADGFLNHVEQRGAQLRAGLAELAAGDDRIADVRGPGLMVATEMVDGPTSNAVRMHALREGHVVFMDCGFDGRTIRWMPPLVVTEAEVDEALAAFAAALKATA
jgi:4-aminobutyrate aminotransferase